MCNLYVYIYLSVQLSTNVKLKHSIKRQRKGNRQFSLCVVNVWGNMSTIKVYIGRDDHGKR